MITEYSYNDHDLKKKCYKCKWLKLDDSEFYGVCECPHNKVRNRDRGVFDNKCSWKNGDKVSK